jgi:hypothetical protein
MDMSLAEAVILSLIYLIVRIAEKSSFHFERHYHNHINKSVNVTVNGKTGETPLEQDERKLPESKRLRIEKKEQMPNAVQRKLPKRRPRH